MHPCAPEKAGMSTASPITSPVATAARNRRNTCMEEWERNQLRGGRTRGAGEIMEERRHRFGFEYMHTDGWRQ